MKTSSRAFLILSALLAFPGLSRAAAERELIDWMRHFLDLIGQEAIDYRTITLEQEIPKEGGPPRAQVKVESSEKFWRLASLIEEKDGAATMSRDDSSGAMMRAADFPVRLGASPERSAATAGWWPTDALRAVREKLKGVTLVTSGRTRVESLADGNGGLLEIELRCADTLPLISTVTGMAKLPGMPPLTGLTLHHDASESKLLARFGGAWSGRPGGSTPLAPATVEERLKAAGATVTPPADPEAGLDFVMPVTDPETTEGLLDGLLPLPDGTVKLIWEAGPQPSVRGTLKP